jgi:intraflagellar transport protein 140
MTFSEGEGSPTHLDVNGQFLAVATDTGLIKLFKVTRREPKQLGSPGHFNLWAHAQNLVPSISISTESQRIHCKTSQGHQATQTQEKSKGNAIRSIRCNSDGTRVSIIADHVR